MTNLTAAHRDFIHSLENATETAMALGMIAELFVNCERSEMLFRRVATLGYGILNERFDAIVDAGCDAGIWRSTMASFTKGGKSRTTFTSAKHKVVCALCLA